METFLSIDIGTTGLKTTLMDAYGRIISSEYAEYPIVSSQPGYAEQDPELWWAGLVNSCRRLQDKFPDKLSRLLGVGICGQMHTQVYLGGRLEVLRPSITWMDQRSSAIVTRINQDAEAKSLVFQETQNFATTTYTALHMKWVQENEKEIWNRVKHILVAKDFIKFRLTGKMITDYSDAAGTLLFDVERRRWSEKMFEFFGFTRSLLPDVIPSDEIIGQISQEAAVLTGIPQGTPVVNGSADHTAASLGAGMVQSGQVTAIIGTAGVISVCSDRPLPDAQSRTLCWNYCLRDKWVILGITQTAGESLNWFKNAFDQRQHSEEDSRDIFEIYNRIGASAPDGSEGLIFLPYLNGERTPYWDPDARGVFFGISLSTGKANFIKAIMEGVSFALRNNVETVESLGIKIDEIRSIGGGTKSPVWLQTLGKILKRPIKTVSVRDAGSLGSVILCGMALGVYTSVEKAVRDIVVADQELYYEEALPVYEKQYALFLDLYNSLKAAFKSAASG
jgi:xylulokinase